MHKYSYPDYEYPYDMAGTDGDDYFDRLVDTAALKDYLTGYLGEPSEYHVDRHQAGHSNETLFVTWGADQYVIRRPPPGETAEGAHEVLREYRVIDALQDTPVNVPTTVAACEDPSIIGSEFYVMEFLEGEVIRTTEPDRFGTPPYRAQIGNQVIDTLSAIATVDIDAVGLRDFGHPDGYTERQVEIWHRQFEWAQEVTTTERTVPLLETIGDWLDDNIPEIHPHTLVHGDYKLDNVMFAPGTPPVLVSVFDWELSTLGDPNADLGYFLIFWRNPEDPDPAIPELMPAFTDREGYPSRQDLVSRWETATGFEFTHERFYRVLGAYKLTAFCEMFYRRHLEGNASNPMYPKMETRVPALAERTHQIITGDEPL